MIAMGGEPAAPTRPRRRSDRGSALRLRARLGALAAASALVVASAQAQQQARIAWRTPTESMSCEALGAASARPCALAALRELRARAEQRFIDAHGLRATADEIATAQSYEEAFARHDRTQRARKLEELETRLVHMQWEMPAAERERLLAFHAVLSRLAAYEAELPPGTPLHPEVPLATLTQWIEHSKLDAALYRRYGGTVAIEPAGARAHGARAALVAEHMQREAVDLPDAEIAHHLLGALRSPPAIVYQGPAAPDFTPYWKRPLVPSYVGQTDPAR